MKIPSLLLAAALAAGPASAEETHLKIATVDMQQLFKEYYKTDEAQKQIAIDRASIQKKNNERLAHIQQLDESLAGLHKQIEDPAVVDSKKQSLYKEWQMKQNELVSLGREREEFIQTKTRALNESMVQRMKVILEEIRGIVQERAKGDGYDYVFDRSGLSTSQVPMLLYTKDATDITAVLLKDLNKGAPAGKEKEAGEKTGPAVNDGK